MKNDPPASSQESLSSSEQVKTSTPTSERSTPPSLPPELWELLQQQDQAAKAFFTPLRPAYRIMLLVAAMMIVMTAVVVCRLLSSKGGIFPRESNLFLLFGFFGSIAAMFVACACVGNLYLHLAAAACTATSGFTVAAFLAPQFTLIRRWVIGPPTLPVEGENK